MKPISYPEIITEPKDFFDHLENIDDICEIFMSPRRIINLGKTDEVPSLEQVNQLRLVKDNQAGFFLLYHTKENRYHVFRKELNCYLEEIDKNNELYWTFVESKPYAFKKFHKALFENTGQDDEKIRKVKEILDYLAAKDPKEALKYLAQETSSHPFIGYTFIQRAHHTIIDKNDPYKKLLDLLVEMHYCRSRLSTRDAAISIMVPALFVFSGGAFSVAMFMNFIMISLCLLNTPHLTAGAYIAGAVALVVEATLSFCSLVLSAKFAGVMIGNIEELTLKPQEKAIDTAKQSFTNAALGKEGSALQSLQRQLKNMSAADLIDLRHEYLPRYTDIFSKKIESQEEEITEAKGSNPGKPAKLLKRGIYNRFCLFIDTVQQGCKSACSSLSSSSP